jgi:hypothetical protein
MVVGTPPAPEMKPGPSDTGDLPDGEHALLAGRAEGDKSALRRARPGTALADGELPAAVELRRPVGAAELGCEQVRCGHARRRGRQRRRRLGDPGAVLARSWRSTRLDS